LDHIAEEWEKLLGKLVGDVRGREPRRVDG